jgi:hypothetical protein
MPSGVTSLALISQWALASNILSGMQGVSTGASAYLAGATIKTTLGWLTPLALDV